MKQLNWGDELLDKKITPEDWRGGVVSVRQISGGGEWHQVNRAGYVLGMRPDGDTPIYPPAGWNGKTEAEIWDAMEKHEVCTIGEDTAAVWVCKDGKIQASIGKRQDWEPDSPADISDGLATSIILALQNAMLLSKRLKQT